MTRSEELLDARVTRLLNGPSAEEILAKRDEESRLEVEAGRAASQARRDHQQEKLRVQRLCEDGEADGEDNSSLSPNQGDEGRGAA